jgi:glycosyltransferase involved in cell wall biosynthesis
MVRLRLPNRSHIMLAMNVTALIPVYNQINSIQELVGKVLATGLVTEIVIIDDGSTDGTQQVIREMNGEKGIKTVLHDEKKGMGASIRTGLDAVSGDVVIIQNPANNYHPDDYPALIQPFENSQVGVVYGSRYLKGWHLPSIQENFLAIKAITFVANMLYNDILNDIVTGYKAFRPEILNGITFNAGGFEFDAEFTAKILKKKVVVQEVPIPSIPGNSARAKKIRLSDSFLAVWTLVKYRFVH